MKLKFILLAVAFGIAGLSFANLDGGKGQFPGGGGFNPKKVTKSSTVSPITTNLNLNEIEVIFNYYMEIVTIEIYDETDTKIYTRTVDTADSDIVAINTLELNSSTYKVICKTTDGQVIQETLFRNNRP